MTTVIIGYYFLSGIIRVVEEVGRGDTGREMTHFKLFLEKTGDYIDDFCIYFPSPSPQTPFSVMPFCIDLVFFLIVLFVGLFTGCAGSLLLPKGLSLVVASRGYSLVVVLGLLTVVASLVAEHHL